MRKLSRGICRGSSLGQRWGLLWVWLLGFSSWLSSSVLDLWEVRGTRDWTSHSPARSLMKPKAPMVCTSCFKLRSPFLCLCSYVFSASNHFLKVFPHFLVSGSKLTVLLSHSYTISHSNATRTQKYTHMYMHRCMHTYNSYIHTIIIIIVVVYS